MSEGEVGGEDDGESVSVDIAAAIGKSDEQMRVAAATWSADKVLLEHAINVSWVVVGAFALMALGLVIQALGFHRKLLDETQASYLTSTVEDYGLFIEGPIGGVLGFFFATRQQKSG